MEHWPTLVVNRTELDTLNVAGGICLLHVNKTSLTNEWQTLTFTSRATPLAGQVDLSSRVVCLMSPGT